MYNLIEYNSNYSETTGNSWFYSKDEATDFNADIANDNDNKSFEYKAKLLGNTLAQPNPNQADGILRIATIAAPLKYLSNFWRSPEMPLINCKVELKLDWAKYCVLSAAGNDNVNNNENDNDGNNVIFTIKGKKYMFLSSLYQQKRIKNYQNFLAKDLRDQSIGMNIKEKVRIKLRQISV